MKLSQYIYEQVKLNRECEIYALTGRRVTPAHLERMTNNERAKLKAHYSYKHGYSPMLTSHYRDYGYMNFLEYLLFWIKSGKRWFSVLCSDETHRVLNVAKSQPRAVDLLRKCKLVNRQAVGHGLIWGYKQTAKETKADEH